MTVWGDKAGRSLIEINGRLLLYGENSSYHFYFDGLASYGTKTGVFFGRKVEVVDIQTLEGHMQDSGWGRDEKTT